MSDLGPSAVPQSAAPSQGHARAEDDRRSRGHQLGFLAGQRRSVCSKFVGDIKAIQVGRNRRVIPLHLDKVGATALDGRIERQLTRIRIEDGLGDLDNSTIVENRIDRIDSTTWEGSNRQINTGREIVGEPISIWQILWVNEPESLASRSTSSLPNSPSYSSLRQASAARRSTVS